MFEIKIGSKSIISFGRSVENPNIPLTSAKILEIIGGQETDAGVSISEANSINFSAVYCATRVISESIASLPLQIFRKTDKGREVIADHSLYFKLHDEPNNFQTSFTFREIMATRQCLSGNAYAFLKRDSKGIILEMIPFGLESSVIPKYDPVRSKIFYVVTENGKQKIVEQINMLHILALSLDGIEGKSPIAIARESIGLGMSMQKFGARFFGKGANPDFILEHPTTLSPQAVENIKSSWAATSGGISNSHKPRVIEEGMKVTKLSIAPEEAQFLQSRMFQITEIARWFRLPPHMLGDLERATFSNVEQQDINFVKYSLAPWLKRWEQELNRKLLTQEEKKNTFIEFNLDGLLRGDTQARGEFYTKMIASRVMSPNEVRRKENMNDYNGGDKFENPNTSTQATNLPDAT